MDIEFKWLPISHARLNNHQEHEPFKYVILSRRNSNFVSV